MGPKISDLRFGPYIIPVKKPGETIRVFPYLIGQSLIFGSISYLKTSIPDLYLAKKRPVVERDGTLIMVDDERMPIKDKSEIKHEMVRFRTLGCYP